MKLYNIRIEITDSIFLLITLDIFHRIVTLIDYNVVQKLEIP